MPVFLIGGGGREGWKEAWPVSLTRLSLSRSSSLMAGMIFRVMEPWDCDCVTTRWISINNRRRILTIQTIIVWASLLCGAHSLCQQVYQSNIATLTVHSGTSSGRNFENLSYKRACSGSFSSSSSLQHDKSMVPFSQR